MFALCTWECLLEECLLAEAWECYLYFCKLCITASKHLREMRILHL